MSKILLIEPQKMLQQAIVLSLFPEHEVQLKGDLSGNSVSAAKDFDLVIIDAAALREANALGGQSSGTIQGWEAPIIWIDEAGGSPTPGRKKVVALNRPIERMALQSAVAECLGTASTSTPTGMTALAEKSERRPAAKETGTSAAADVADAQVIELVDVVEEGKNKAGQPQKKTK